MRDLTQASTSDAQRLTKERDELRVQVSDLEKRNDTLAREHRQQNEQLIELKEQV